MFFHRPTALLSLHLLIAALAPTAFAQPTHAPLAQSEDPAFASPAFNFAPAAQAIGRPNHGCIQGAQTLPAEDASYISIRRHRQRYFAHPTTIALIQRTSAELAARHPGRRILIGDLGQALGGKLPYGHRSHQNGLDFDVWFYRQPLQEALPNDIEPPSVADLASGRIIAHRWNPALRDALYLFATADETARIFVNPVIKQHLCQSETDRRWLGRLRPWWGHDAHFHVRLHCPADSPLCQDQAPIPAGDGCDGDLANWVSEQSERILYPERFPKRSSPKPKPEEPLHPACAALFAGDQPEFGE